MSEPRSPERPLDRSFVAMSGTLEELLNQELLKAEAASNIDTEAQTPESIVEPLQSSIGEQPEQEMLPAEAVVVEPNAELQDDSATDRDSKDEASIEPVTDEESQAEDEQPEDSEPAAEESEPDSIKKTVAEIRRLQYEASKAAINAFSGRYGLGAHGAMILRAHYIGDKAEFLDEYTRNNGVVSGFDECMRRSFTVLRQIDLRQRIALDAKPSEKTKIKPTLTWPELEVLELLIGTPPNFADPKSYDGITKRLAKERIIIDGKELTEALLSELTLSAFRKIVSKLAPSS